MGQVHLDFELGESWWVTDKRNHEFKTPVFARNDLARAVRLKADPSVILDARQVLAEAKIANFVKQVLQDSPALSLARRKRLASVLFHGGSA